MSDEFFKNIDLTGEKEQKTIQNIIKYQNIILKQYPLASKYYINPYKDERCSKNCYLNWVKYNQDIPRYHSCQCDSFKFNSVIQHN